MYQILFFWCLVIISVISLSDGDNFDYTRIIRLTPMWSLEGVWQIDDYTGFKIVTPVHTYVLKCK